MRIVRNIIVMLRLCRNYVYDLNRYRKHSQTGKQVLNEKQLSFRILQKAHSIEKALALESPRVPFGKSAMTDLLEALSIYSGRRYSRNSVPFLKALSAINHYIAFHRSKGYAIERELPTLNDFLLEGALIPHPSTTNISKDEFLLLARSDFRTSLVSRQSVRIFEGTAVDSAPIRRAVQAAQSAPSVCNRQSCEVYHIVPGDKMAKVLKIQGGNSGFGESLGGLLVVVSSLSAFRGPSERYQCWVDGGLFAMALLGSLHYEGVGTCSLNWSADVTKDRALRDVVPIEDSDQVIMLIGIGNLKDNFRVARSPRRDFDSVFHIVS